MKNIKKPFVLVAACSVLLVATAVGQTSGNADNGKELYYDHACYSCHGYGGIGRHNIANNASGILVNEQVFITYLRARADMNPQFPTQSMPNYAEESLSDDEVKDIYAYIRTLKDEPPEVEDIPALKSILDDAAKVN
jgi:mono/diheme cytochrome c family protein